MKKISYLFILVTAAIIASCGNGTPKANIKTDVDTFSYAMGMSQSNGLKNYLADRLGVDTTEMDEFIKGLNEGINAGDDKKKSAYFAGIQIGQQISTQMIKGINHEIFGEDSTQTISLDNFVAGFVSGINRNESLMSQEEAHETAQKMFSSLQEVQLTKRYAEWKQQNEDFLSKLNTKGNVKKLSEGVYYEVIKEGIGAIPADTSRVEVNYEGTLIDNTKFDSSYDRNEPITIRCNQVIPGWTEALTHMPVGSKWKVYISSDKAYGKREQAQIKPFSTLIFTMELLSIQ